MEREVDKSTNDVIDYVGTELNTNSKYSYEIMHQNETNTLCMTKFGLFKISYKVIANTIVEIEVKYIATGASQSFVVNEDLNTIYTYYEFNEIIQTIVSNINETINDILKEI